MLDLSRRPNDDPIGANPLTKVSLSRISRYRSTLIYPDLGPSFGRFSLNRFSIPSSQDDAFHKVNQGERFRLDIIAWKRYDNPLFWWVLALANGIRNPFVEPDLDTILRVPSLDRIISTLLPN